MATQARSGATSRPGRPKDQEKRHAILDAARILFIRRGYINTSMDAIASAAGVSKLTVYNHFTSIRGMLHAAILTACQERVSTLKLECTEGSVARDVLLTTGYKLQAIMNSDDLVGLARLVVGQGDQLPGMGEYFYNVLIQAVLEQVEALLHSMNEQGLLRIDNALRSAESFLSLIKGVSSDRRLIFGSVVAKREDEMHVCEVVRIFMQAFGVSEDRNSMGSGSNREQ